MLVQPSNFQWNRFKDLLHFYVLLGVIPCTLISLYANIFIGEAELTDIPEGYVPEEHEYYKVYILLFCFDFAAIFANSISFPIASYLSFLQEILGE